ncbi:MAG TPA: DUF4177 domain-containing protein [Longimicrobium sp.]|jgi:hypothetical protein|uniref:DUF4177 domain-containing protein n=1 Tax=Longimicrobium sp. TaxID=2029185 RepID=UPI002EDB7891
MTMWEYQTFKLQPGGYTGGEVDKEELDALLRREGRAGWELASTFVTHNGEGLTREVVLIFKRPAPDRF